MKFTLLFCFIFTSVVSMAQDVIVKNDGSTILSKIIKVGDKEIEYKKYNSSSERLYSISTSDVMAINYEDGDKDVFGGKERKSNESSSESAKLVDKSPDAKNKELLNIYNRTYKFTDKISRSNKIAKYCLLIFGVKSNSIMSNEDVEMHIIRKIEDDPYGRSNTNYYINLTNKTDKTIYIDKGNSFRIYNNGKYHCYYDNTEQTTVNLGGGNGASIGLGSIAGVLGISGAVGQLASGVSVGGGSNHSTSKTYSQQRILAIPPHANVNLTENRWVQTKKGNLLSSPDYDLIEKSEEFYLEWVKCSDLGLKRGMVKQGEDLCYSEDNSPYTKQYIITYSSDANFSNYSILKTTVFLHQLVGCQSSIYYSDKHERYIDGLNEHTIEGSRWFDK